MLEFFLFPICISVLDWPVNSPDFYPIEEACNAMKKKCGRLQNNTNKLQEGVV